MKLVLLLILSIANFAWAQSAAEAQRIVSKSSNFYEVLNVSPTATEKEIKMAFRRLISVYHPDKHAKNPANIKAANQVMERLNAAVETLSNPLKRKSYDTVIKATAAVKPTPPKPAATKAASAWEKYSYSDFSKEKAKAEAPKAEPKAKPQPEPAKAQAKAEPAQQREGIKPKAETTKPSTSPPLETKEVKTTSSQGTTTKIGPTSFKAQQAQKLYSEISQCGTGYFKSFIDIMQ